MRCVSVGGVTLGPGNPLVLIAGPCVVEDEAIMEQVAAGLSELSQRYGLPLIFKASYEKDNRTSAAAYRGPGIGPGLEALARLRRRYGFPVTSDVHRVEDLPRAAQALDLIQIPALLCRQTSLLEAAGRSGPPVNIKKGQFASLGTVAGAVDKVRGAGVAQVLLTERGSCYGPERLVCDLERLPALAALDCPVVFDAGHTANSREGIALLARCGVAAGADALFVECHPDPRRALCDGSRMLSLEELDDLLGVVAVLGRLVRGGLSVDRFG